MGSVTHNTFVVEREYPKGPDKVFAAFADPAKKKRWYAGGGAHDVANYSIDFRLGGNEVLVGKMKPGTPIAGAVLTWAHTFDDIVEDERIVFTQTLDVGERRISAAVITVEISPTDAGSKLKLTHQAAFFGPADGPQMREFGWRALLNAIADALD